MRSAAATRNFFATKCREFTYNFTILHGAEITVSKERGTLKFRTWALVGNFRPVSSYTSITAPNASRTFSRASSTVSPSVRNSGSSGEVTVYPPSGCGDKVSGILYSMVAPVLNQNSLRFTIMQSIFAVKPSLWNNHLRVHPRGKLIDLSLEIAQQNLRTRAASQIGIEGRRAARTHGGNRVGRVLQLTEPQVHFLQSARCIAAVAPQPRYDHHQSKNQCPLAADREAKTQVPMGDVVRGERPTEDADATYHGGDAHSNNQPRKHLACRRRARLQRHAWCGGRFDRGNRRPVWQSLLVQILRWIEPARSKQRRGFRSGGPQIHGPLQRAIELFSTSPRRPIVGKHGGPHGLLLNGLLGQLDAIVANRHVRGMVSARHRLLALRANDAAAALRYARNILMTIPTPHSQLYQSSRDDLLATPLPCAARHTACCSYRHARMRICNDFARLGDAIVRWNHFGGIAAFGAAGSYHSPRRKETRISMSSALRRLAAGFSASAANAGMRSFVSG